MKPFAVPVVAEDAARRLRRGHPRGRQVSEAARAEVLDALEGRVPRRDELIEALHRLQDRFGQLGTPHLAALAAWMKLSQAEVFEVASFYHHFDVVREDIQGQLPHPPRLTVRVCDGLACMLAGAADLRERLSRSLPADVRVVAAPCVGRCERAPVAVVQQRTLAPADAASVEEAVQAGAASPEPTGHLSLEGSLAQGGYAMLRECLRGARTPESVISALEEAGLRGLGGAGFPAGRKWQQVRARPGPRLMAVNLDEGEPGTFKDRWILERDPHRFLEGMFIAAWAVGADRVYIYLRDEYHHCRVMLEHELAQIRRTPPAPGLPEVELRRGAGAYICGEESAMLESIEGRRGWPRLRPPYVAERGLFGRPTLVHNFETLCWVRDILALGPAAFAGQGRRGRRGVRNFSVSGRVREPGVKLAPAGISLRELVDEHCGGMAAGHELYAFLPGGASGGILPARLANEPLDFDTLAPHGAFIGSAAVIVLSTQDRVAEVARQLMDFFVRESCGQCTPCRQGTVQARRLMEAGRWDAGLLGELSQVMREASICGLGQAAPNVFDSVLRHFPHEVGEGPR